MVGVVAAHEAGVFLGFFPGRPREHPDVECFGLCFVDAALLGMTDGSRGNRHCGDRQYHNPAALHEVLGNL
jgi:hypothetical protein